MVSQNEPCSSESPSFLSQYDAAVDPEIARTKIKGESQVAGRASVLIVPDLQVGNIVYKVTPPSPPLYISEAYLPNSTQGWG